MDWISGVCSSDLQGGLPFDPGCLTEDYELGLRIGAHGGRGVFIRMRDDAGDLVCTREYFPATLTAAVRQKARWMTGIALAGWDSLGWQGSLAERRLRFRDRRGPRSEARTSELPSLMRSTYAVSCLKNTKHV